MGSYSVGGEAGGGGAYYRRAFCSKIWLLKPRPQGLLAIMKAEHSSRWGGDWKEQTRGHSNHACVELKIQDGGQHTSETDR